ncbi:MAG TPA: polysaccharide biosynthesis/export family protein [Bacteroidia bacterium]|nr:polysaccharide biosynthesis/export family protein [Bacteroidia bacterium]
MKRFWLFIFCLPLLFSCRSLNPSIMFKTGKNYQFIKPDSVAMKIQSEYKLAPFNEIELHIYTNDGYKLVDISTTAASQGVGSSLIQYAVESDGFVKLPLLGRVELNGLTVREAEKLLEEKYAAYYNKPFILLKVLNRKVMVFKGEGGSAAVVPLSKDNMNLIEALAATGGLAVTGKAYNIKLIRGSPKNPQIFRIDLSTVEGMKQADLQLQANDIIYIEPTRNIAESVLVKISPVIGLLTTIVLTIAIFAK